MTINYQYVCFLALFTSFPIFECFFYLCVVSYIPFFLPSFLVFSLSLHLFIYLSPILSKYILE